MALLSIGGARPLVAPTWSPDGRSILFNVAPWIDALMACWSA